MSGALLVAGTQSDAGKSLITAGICRYLKRRGLTVAPFKAQNMALNSTVTPGGAEIGRAQALQAAAAGVEPEAAMNPVLIKPSGERHSQVILMGRPYANASARSYQELKAGLREPVLSALDDLRSRFDAVICEGAGSPAEINLRAGDLANMGLARAARLPVVVVGDIDRGGVFASFFGTLALLEPADQELVAGFVINKFRGDHGILAPGIAQIESLTGRRVLGTVPYRDGLAIDAEDSLALDHPEPLALGDGTLDVAVLRLRWISNFTDVDALRSEPGVRVRFTRSAADVERADLVIVPGTKATVEDLERLRADGLDVALTRRAAMGGPILGICGGYQLLGGRIEDEVESGRGAVAGLGLLPVETTFAAEKLVRRVEGSYEGLPATGYEIRHGRPVRRGGQPLILVGGAATAATSANGAPAAGAPNGGHAANVRGADASDPAGAPNAHGASDGCIEGAVLGTSWHGLLENDAVRRALLSWVATTRGRAWSPGTHRFADLREQQLDRLGDLVEEHLDTDALLDLLDRGAPANLPLVAPEGVPWSYS